MKKKYLIIGILLYLCVVPILLYIAKNAQKKPSTNNTVSLGIESPTNTSVAPYTTGVFDRAKITRQTVGNTSTFTMTNLITGFAHAVYQSSLDVKYENMGPQNWSTNNRFAYVYMDTGTQRNLLFFQSDGRFTDAQYFLEPLKLKPTETVISGKWIDADTFYCETMDMSNRTTQKYTINFDDSVGVVIPGWHDDGN